MQYQQPVGEAANDPYVTGVPGVTPGSIPPGESIEHPQREIINVIEAAGLTPSAGDLTQLLQAIVILGRIKLTADLTLYVSTAGNDANSGLAVGTPFLTIQKAWDTLVKNYDLNGYTVTIQLADGTTYAGFTAAGLLVGQTSYEQVIMNGNSGAPADVQINSAVNVVRNAMLSVRNFKITSAAQCFQAISGGIIYILEGLVFGGCGTAHAHINSAHDGLIYVTAAYTIVAGGAYHIYVSLGGLVIYSGGVVGTLSGAPAFSLAFVYAQTGAVLQCTGITWSGAAGGAGVKFTGASNAVIDTGTSNNSFFPGVLTGSGAGTGAQYL